MLINEDINRIIKVVVTKEDVKELKEEILALKGSVQPLTVSIYVSRSAYV